MTQLLLDLPAEPRRQAPPPRPALTAVGREPAVPPAAGAPAAHASPLAWAAPGTPEAVLERRLADANAEVADPAARLARSLCVVVAAAIAQPAAMRALAPRFVGTPAAQTLRADVAWGQVEGRFPAHGLAAAALAAVGVAEIALRRTLDHPETVSPGLARELSFGLLRAIGLADDEAGALARHAVREIFDLDL